MELITEYALLVQFSDSHLVMEVNKALLKGFQPLGGVSVVQNKPDAEFPYSFIQTMVKYNS